jgi:vacuolar-type H+-ATPase subunit H
VSDAVRTSGSGSPGSVVAAQVAALLARLDHYRDRRCHEIRQRAEETARSIEREAWHAAAARGRDALRMLRQRMEAERQRVSAMVDAEIRRGQQQQDRRRLDELHERLPRALAIRWSEAAARAAWIAAAIDAARRYLVADEWTIEHPASIAQDALADALAELARKRRVAITFLPRTGISEGIVIASDGARIDATSAGLLSDTDRIESTFLGDFHAPQSAAAASGLDHG